MRKSNGKKICKIYEIIEHDEKSLLVQKRKYELLDKVIYIDKKNSSEVDIHRMEMVYSNEQIKDINNALYENIQNNLSLMHLNACASIYKAMKRNKIMMTNL
jgi:hypothetical protein